MRMTPSSPLHFENFQCTPREKQYVQAMVDAHGFEPFTKKAAASHEGGHVTVMSAMGGAFTSCNLSTDKAGNWGGFTEMGVDGIHGEDFIATLEPKRAFWMAVIRGSGIAAEKLTNNWHPTSSVDELLMVTRAAACIQAATGTKGTDVVADVERVCQEILTENRSFFNAVSGHLFNQRRLMKSDWARYIKFHKPTADMSLLTPTYLQEQQK